MDNGVIKDVQFLEVNYVRNIIRIITLAVVAVLGLHIASAEQMTVSIIKQTDESHGIFASSEGLIPWGHGQISFDISEESSGITASVSYYSKNGRAAEEVLCWNIMLNNDEKANFKCEQWFVFPDGGQCNYTNPQPFEYDQNVHSVTLIPDIAGGKLSDDFPDIVGQIDSTIDTEAADAKGEVHSEEKAILWAKKVYALQEISLGVDADQLEWSARLGEEGGWYVVTAWDPVAWDPQSPPYEVKQFNETNLTKQVQDKGAELVFKKAEKLFNKYTLSHEQAEVAADTFINIMMNVGVNDLGEDLAAKVELAAARAKLVVPDVVEAQTKDEVPAEVVEDVVDVPAAEDTAEEPKEENKEEDKPEEKEEKPEVKVTVEKPSIDALKEGVADGDSGAANSNPITADNVLQVMASVPFIASRPTLRTAILGFSIFR